jgi:adenosylcobinamide-phosphate synthase
VPRRRDGAARGRDRALAAGLAAAVLVDALLADPRRGHPVAGFGRVAGWLERLLWRPSRAAGALYVAALVAPPTVAAAVLDRRLRGQPHRPGRPHRRAALVAVTGWAVLGAASLAREAVGLRHALTGGAASGPAVTEPAVTEPAVTQSAAAESAAAPVAANVAAARARLPRLCGRDPARLDAAGLARATIESVAENTSDAAVAPLLWGAVAGPAGLVAYRAVNTLDAMVGHRSDRYREFGWAAARLDDLVNLAPARLTAALATVLAPAVGGRPGAAWRAWRWDAPAHPSPNAGRCEAAFAGALGVRLGGPTVYPYGRSERPWLGAGREPGPADIDRAVTLSRLVTWSAAALCAGYAAGRRQAAPLSVIGLGAAVVELAGPAAAARGRVATGRWRVASGGTR